MAGEAVAYSYINVGVNPAPDRAGVAYSMWNLGSSGARSIIGRVVGFAAMPRLAFLSSYANVGVWFDPALGLPGTVYVTWNQLEQAAGALRTLEDGSPRDLEDGTQRTLE